MAAFGGWLLAQRRRISAKSGLGGKLAYIHNHWEGLQTFLTDGRVEIDSNRVENMIRPLALDRKNALFAGHDQGGIAWGRIASLIETCKIKVIEPLAYLKATLEALANGHPQSRIDDLFPWNFIPSSCHGRGALEALTVDQARLVRHEALRRTVLSLIQTS